MICWHYSRIFCRKIWAHDACVCDNAKFRMTPRDYLPLIPPWMILNCVFDETRVLNWDSMTHAHFFLEKSVWYVKATRYILNDSHILYQKKNVEMKMRDEFALKDHFTSLFYPRVVTTTTINSYLKAI